MSHSNAPINLPPSFWARGLLIISVAFALLVGLIIFMLATGYKFQVGKAEIGFISPKQTKKGSPVSLTTGFLNIKKIASGSTEAGNTGWKKHKDVGGEGFYLYVSTESAGFNKTPVYLISVAGKNDLWRLTGTATIYNPTPKGFEVYLRYPFPVNWKVTPDFPNHNKWHINWIGLELKK